MNEEKLKKLFAAARKENVSAPPPDFPADVLRAIRREPQSAIAPQTFSIFDQLNLLFPRIALAAAAVIILCAAADYGLTAAGVPELDDGAAQVSAQQFFSPDDFSL
jgi:hypothetical protein